MNEPSKSQGELLERARRVLVGGVNSPVRSFKSVGGEPLFVKRASGPYIYGADGRQYVDYVCSWGALILGHANEAVVEAIKERAEQGTSYGTTTELEVELAELVVRAFPSIEMLRLVNSGTEAVMSAIRLARGFTGRKKIVKFEGCYHGHADYLLVKSGSGLATYSLPSSAGVPDEVIKDTIVLPYNDVESVESVFRSEGEVIACVVVEPIAGNMGVIPSRKEFLQTIRELTARYGALLIFDEVITGFRVSLGGAQELYGIEPDLTCLGKIIGGGLPVGAYGGRGEVMEMLSPLGPVYQAGTLSGNPLCVAAGIATLKQLRRETYTVLENTSAELARGITDAAYELGVPILVNRVGSMMSIFFTEREEVTNYDEVASIDRERFARFFWEAFKEGIYLPPSPFESMFVSTAHDEAAIDKTLGATRTALRRIRGSNP